MRVLIDTTYARRAPFSGTGVYIRRLCDELAAVDGVELIQVANERRRPPAGGGIGSIRNLLGDLRWTVAGAASAGAPSRRRADPPSTPGAESRVPGSAGRHRRRPGLRAAAGAFRPAGSGSTPMWLTAAPRWQHGWSSASARRRRPMPGSSGRCRPSGSWSRHWGPARSSRQVCPRAQNRPTSSTSAMRNRARTWDCCWTPTRSTAEATPGPWSWSWPDPPRRTRPASRPLLGPARQS